MSKKIEQEKKSYDLISPYENVLTSVSSSLAALFLEENIRKGYEIEIPSLGIIIGKERLSKNANHLLEKKPIHRGNRYSTKEVDK